MKFSIPQTLENIASIVGCDFVGDPNFAVLGMNEIHVVEPGDIVFVDHPKSYPNDEPQRRCPDLIKSNKHLKYKPKTKLTPGLKKYFSWAKLHYKY